MSGFFTSEGNVRPRSSRGRSENSGGGKSSFDFFSWNDAPAAAKPTMSTTRHAMETARSKPAAGASKAAGISSRSTFNVGGSASYRMHNGENVPLNSSRPGSSRRVNESQNSRVVFGTNVGTAGGEVAPYRETSHVSQRKQSELYESVNIFGKDNKKTMNRYHKVPSQKVRDLDGTNALIPHVVENRAAAVAATPVETPSSSARPSPPASTVDEIPASKPVPAAMREEIGGSTLGETAAANGGGIDKASSRSPGKRPGSATNKTRLTFDGTTEKMCSPEQLKQWRAAGSYTPRVRPSPGGNSTYKFGESEAPSRNGFMTSTKRLPPGGYSSISIT
ncbi:hypothetical protein NFJ02_43g110590 [Pycnococcus provasolii]